MYLTCYFLPSFNFGFDFYNQLYFIIYGFIIFIIISLDKIFKNAQI